METPSGRTSQMNRGFIGWVMGSLLLHGGFVGGVVYAQSLKPPPIDSTRSIPVELVQLGKPRDPKLLPRKAPPPPPAEPVAAPPPKAPPPAADAVPLETKKPEKKPDKKPPKKPAKKAPELSDAARRLLDSRSSADGSLDDALKKLDREGSESGSANGTTTDPARAAEGYAQELLAALKARYEVPAPIPSAQRRFLEARVVLFLDPQGRIKKFEFTKRHSNKLFMSALEKLLANLKLPKPPKVLRRQVATKGIEVIFSP